MSVRQMVRKVLSQSTICRDDDRALVAGVTQISPNANPVTIVRYRAYYQNKRNLFLPVDPNVAKRRNRHKTR